MDESITIAEHKILLTLKVPAEHPGWPLETRLSTLQGAEDVDFKAALERNRIVDVKLWERERENLPGNLAAKRARVLRQAC